MKDGEKFLGGVKESCGLASSCGEVKDSAIDLRLIEPQKNLVLLVTEHRTNFQTQPAGRIGLLALATINVTTVVSLGGLPSEAKYGLAAVFYYLFAAVFFLVPVALVSAELTTGWPEEGGVFRWVSVAIGDLWALIAVSSLWMSFTILFPSCLIYGATSLAFTGPDILWDKALAENKHYVIAIVLSLYWLATAITLKGSE